MSSITYISIFAKDIDNYIQFKCSMGYSKSTYDNALKRFDRFCAENFPEANSITEDIAIAWSEKRNNESDTLYWELSILICLNNEFHDNGLFVE